jgi:hypothetical protein
MVGLVKYGMYTQGYLSNQHLLKVAGYEAPIGGWF